MSGRFARAMMQYSVAARDDECDYGCRAGDTCCPATRMCTISNFGVCVTGQMAVVWAVYYFTSDTAARPDDSMPCPYQKTHPTCEMIFFAALPSLISLAGRSLLHSRWANLLLRYSLAAVFRLNLTVFISLFLKQLADRDDAVHQLGELR
jgi:hypothetical protein